MSRKYKFREAFGVVGTSKMLAPAWGHIFHGKLHPKPYLKDLATQLGGESNVIRAALENANGRFPTSGIFELPVNIGTSNLTIRGFVNNGKPIINTMF